MIHVLLPAFNEADALPGLFTAFAEALSGRDYRVWVVDDGSTDDTAAVVARAGETLPVERIAHSRNRGLGAAMRTGLGQLAANAGAADVIVAMDADATHDPALVPAMLAEVGRGADVVIASRYAPGGREVGLERHRKLLSAGASGLLKRVFPVAGVRDYTCGYRMYRVAVVRAAIERYGSRFIVENSFVCMAEILIKIAYLPATVAEVPLVLRYDLKTGPSKLKKLRTIMRYGRFILREKRNGLVPAPRSRSAGS